MSQEKEFNLGYIKDVLERWDKEPVPQMNLTEEEALRQKIEYLAIMFAIHTLEEYTGETETHHFSLWKKKYGKFLKKYKLKQ